MDVSLSLGLVSGLQLRESTRANKVGTASGADLSGMLLCVAGRLHRHCGAPADNHSLITARSSAVISVTFPGGIAFAHAAFRPISRALRLMWAESSSKMRFGAVTIDAQTGSAP